MEHKWKLRFLVTLGVMYCVSLLLLTIGFFTPEWVLSYSEKKNPVDFVDPYTNCDTVGLVSGVCRYPYGDLSIGTVMDIAMFMTLTGLILLFSNALMLVVGYICDLFGNPIYETFLGLSFGVLYPIASVLVLVASIYVEAAYWWQSGFSVILCNIAGALMLLFYIGLRVYDTMYSNNRNKQDMG